MLRVRFTQTAGSYHANDVAGFEEADAARYVENGVAVYVDEPPPSDAPFSEDESVVTDTSTAAEEAIDTRTHDLTVGKAKALIEEVEDADELAMLLAGEQQHPKYPGGRSGVVSAIEERAATL